MKCNEIACSLITFFLHFSDFRLKIKFPMKMFYQETLQCCFGIGFKEVRWSVDSKTEKILRLNGRVTDIY